MRIVYFDVDSLRPDHLGCYGYHRATSPNLDRIAAEGLRFDNVYSSDAPCLPSRTAMFTGRFGIHTGVASHRGAAAEPFSDGLRRGFGTVTSRTSWMRCLRDAGLYTAAVSSFGERHAGWHWCANFREILNPGHRGMENADAVSPLAIDWLQRRGRDDDWFLHVNLWDPHTPYRTPDDFGDPFTHDPLPAWYDESVRAAHWAGYGPNSARDLISFSDDDTLYQKPYPRQPRRIDSMAAARQMFDGYDTGVRYADHHIGRILDTLDQLGVLDETAIVVSADHGENLGELGVYGDHHTADQFTTRLPMIIRWPGLTDGHAGQSFGGLHYQFDVAATMVELVGGRVPEVWHATSFADDLRAGRDSGRDSLVISQAAWTCQRSVRFRDGDAELICIRTYHDGYHPYPDVMLFDLTSDPHEQDDLASRDTPRVNAALARLDAWYGEMMRRAAVPTDPMWVVMHEGGPAHTRGELPAYLDRLRATGRGHHADALIRRHGDR